MDDIRLTPLSLDDAEALMAFEIANRAWFEAWVTPRPEGYWQLDTLREIIRGQLDDPEPMYLIRAGETIIGRLNFTRFDADSAEIGYRIGEDMGGKGVATRAVLLACEVGMALGLKALRARIRRPNLASAKVLEKTGFALVNADDEIDFYRKMLAP